MHTYINEKYCTKFYVLYLNVLYIFLIMQLVFYFFFATKHIKTNITLSTQSCIPPPPLSSPIVAPRRRCSIS